jgi:integrase
MEALNEMKGHRYWSETTWEAYNNDVKLFEEYLMENQNDPFLKNGENIEIVNKWIQEHKQQGVATSTIERRIAALSSIYSFYKELGIVKKNPFKASRIPAGATKPFCRALTLDDLKEVYGAVQELKLMGVDIEIPVKLLIFTGLRNHSLSALKVSDIRWQEELLLYDSKILNSKHKVQLFPIPPIFLKRLRDFVNDLNLKPEDPLCYGLQGQPLRNKQLNFITNHINKYLGWEKDERITPHGFRYTIASLLDEKELPYENIKFLLGHSSQENVQRYIKTNHRKIYQIRKVLVEVEEVLENHSNNQKEKGIQTENTQEQADKNSNSPDKVFPFSEEFITKLLKENPILLEKILLQHYSA